MEKMVNTAGVFLWGSLIGAVTWQEDREYAVFQYSTDFQNSGIQVAPLMMPLREFPYEFPALPRNTFRGLPGMLADSLPDRFGNALIDAWLAAEGRSTASFHPVERLCYIGRRGMGALEYEPALVSPYAESDVLDVARLVDLANKILKERANLTGVFSGKEDRKAMEDILRVGSSAGGARAKAVLAWNPETKKFRSGQVEAGQGFEYWILKFDGIQNNRDKELSDPLGFGRIEYAYHLMAVEAGIRMMQCELFEEGPRCHFMTRRFDRTDTGGKYHMQSLGALRHLDYNQSGSSSYEQAIEVIRRLGLPRTDLEQQVLRAMFNVVCRNCDDHVKKIAFLMNQRGEWRLSPAFDLTYAWNPQGEWTNRHQMSVNQKRESIERDDLAALADRAGIKSKQANEMMDQVLASAGNWLAFADEAGMGERRAEEIRGNLCLDL
ncbi:MAG: type II toxin-antitoxin system HipA family toxin [Anaerolineales bacterium]|nr:type II toxin-antitoxin system HipA family toxin [Anaerolineales bacterium]